MPSACCQRDTLTCYAVNMTQYAFQLSGLDRHCASTIADLKLGMAQQPAPRMHAITTFI